MKSVAANYIVINQNRILNNHYINIDDNGFIQSIMPLEGIQVEPHSTLFYNGVITNYIAPEFRVIGNLLLTQLQDDIKVGSKANLLLWQNISLTDLKITTNTKVQSI